MELIKNLSQLLTKLRDHKAARYRDENISAPCVIRVAEFPLQAWQDFVGYVDEAQKDPECSCRDHLKQLAKLNSNSETHCLDFFADLARNTATWRPIVKFAEIPAQFDNELFDSIISEYGKARSIAEQIKMIPTLFASADPTRLELLCLLLEGDIERHPQPFTPTVKELVEREKAARAQLAALLADGWSDEVRWWLIRSLTSSAAPARSFLRSCLPANHDKRMVCMAFPILLKAGFALLKSHSDQSDPKSGQAQKLYSGQLNRLTGIIGDDQ